MGFFSLFWSKAKVEVKSYQVPTFYDQSTTSGSDQQALQGLLKGASLYNIPSLTSVPHMASKPGVLLEECIVEEWDFGLCPGGGNGASALRKEKGLREYKI